MSNVPYSNAVGSLMYATMCTRPNIYYAVGMVNCYQANPGMMHWKEIKRILRHLKGTKDILFVTKAKNCVWWVIQMPIGQVI
ncbi:Retrovirus-related Pol polyprotein from transposon TNT 1-94 [Vitis vinifera]|uniref:Retrovirus-related Pol polyprotein from transposon TNT 1-94 n=1 Tax=Vitis vinifera TaxID=29760 RepID=A0A438FXS5_VITVI|nr:Retrovirus-related Pol polyprotein from transposon TNT 1-94 [Vitis vinifera]